MFQDFKFKSWFGFDDMLGKNLGKNDAKRAQLTLSRDHPALLPVPSYLQMSPFNSKSSSQQAPKGTLDEIGFDPEHTLSIWTIYENPSDYPGLFVLREFLMDLREPGSASIPVPICYAAETLAAIRSILPRHLVKMDRNEFDYPTVVESWV